MLNLEKYEMIKLEQEIVRCPHQCLFDKDLLLFVQGGGSDSDSDSSRGGGALFLSLPTQTD